MAMQEQAASDDVNHVVAHFDLLGVEIDEGVVDEVLDEMAIDTPLALETQRWLVARGMAAVSLAATVHLDEDYYRALAALGDGPAGGDEVDFAARFLTKLGEDLQETFSEEGAESPAGITSDLQRRMADRDVLLGLYGQSGQQG